MSLFQKNHQTLCYRNEKFSLTISEEFLNNVSYEMSLEDKYFEKTTNSEVKFLTYGKFFPGSPLAYNAYKEFQKKHTDNFCPDTYWDAHDDYHGYSLGVGLYDILVNNDCDPNVDVLEVKPPINTLICLGSGRGLRIKELIQQYQPTSIMVFVTEWEQFYSSFEGIDWQEVDSYVQKLGGYFIVQRVLDSKEVISACCGVDAITFELAALYFSGSSDSKLQKIYSELVDGRMIQNVLAYTGYVLDEYNMIRKCAKTFQYCGLIYRKPRGKMAQNVIVTASGPSLDISISEIFKLQDTHLIVAAGSSFRTLIKNKIRVDYLVLVERSDLVYEVYKEYIESIEPPYPILVMANTCHHLLLNVFPQVITYFRPATTAVSVFATSDDEILIA